ncbi:MAG: HD domain-containing protein [Proteobacteria bacterium]|nr:HD domain-containing protein [Pseudomonadota bacterium]MBU1571440.1 HD domain-containing protein [Pseudomonadota bacterium]
MGLSSELEKFNLASDPNSDTLSMDNNLNKLLKSVLKAVKSYAENQLKHIEQRTKIGLALSIEKDIDKLLEMIVLEARAMSNADAGTLYIKDKENQHLDFKIMQNDTMNVRMGGTSGVDIKLPPVPMYIDGKPNHFNVSSHVAISGNIINIPDVYEAEGFDFTGPKKYDAKTGYRSKSMIVIPLTNHENDIIGVLQLLNAKNPETGEVIGFLNEYVDDIASLASQAAVALTNTKLIQDLTDLLYSFIKSIAMAIDEKSSYTGGHIKRVVDLSMMIAEEINETKSPPFEDIAFDNNEMEELHISAWMHDIGKITTPEYVVDKRTKLQTIFDRIILVETRFDLIRKLIENKYLNRKLELLQKGADKNEIESLDSELETELKNLESDLESIKSSNLPGEFMSDDKISKVKEIAAKTYLLSDGEHPYITDEELENLTIRKGSVTEKERKIIENHSAVAYKMLSQLPFPKKLRNVPVYASEHHEKLDGSGYPDGLTSKNLPLQSRIIAVADIFEALTARDRPYRKPMHISQALKIMDFMKKDNHIDPDIYDLFVESRLCEKYMEREDIKNGN